MNTQPELVTAGWFRKKPVVIEAMQWDGTVNGIENIKNRFPLLQTLVMAGYTNKPEISHWVIDTLEGSLTATPGDWIIKGVKGEFYPCKPDIFAATYESAALASAQAQPDTQQTRRAVAAIAVVGQIDGHDVIRRDSVLEIVERHEQPVQAQGVPADHKLAPRRPPEAALESARAYRNATVYDVLDVWMCIWNQLAAPSPQQAEPLSDSEI